MSLSAREFTARLLLSFSAALLFLSCEQYEYISPDPGVIEVRLKTVNSREDLIPFSSIDSLLGRGAFMDVTLLELLAYQTGDVRQPIFSDLYAVRRNELGDIITALDSRARDSLIILGQAYAPPVTFSGLEMTVTAPQFVFISFGFYGSLIPVTSVQPYQAVQILPGNIPIESGRTTRVTVTFNLDASLIQQTESFLFTPVFFISSVEIL